MTYLDRISRRDLEQLSAYLDGELREREAQKIRSRLEADSALRAALDELRGTVAVVRDLPQVRPPRSFTLTEELAGTGRRPYPLLQFSAALATLTFVLLVGADVVIRGTLEDPKASIVARRVLAEPEVPESQPLELESMPAAEMAESEGLAAAEVEEEVAAEAVGEVAGEAAEEGAAENAQALAPAQEPAGTPHPAESEATGDSSKATADELELQSEESAPADDLAQESQPRDPDAQDQFLGFQADQLEGDQLSIEQPAREELSSLLPALRVGEVLLAAMAIVLVGLSLWARRT